MKDIIIKDKSIQLERFFIQPNEFNISKEETTKISISKLELSKVINIFTQQSNEKKNKDFEDETVENMESWLENVQNQIEDEIEKFYG